MTIPTSPNSGEYSSRTTVSAAAGNDSALAFLEEIGRDPVRARWMQEELVDYSTTAEEDFDEPPAGP